jgi:RimJ/RimL family protein N-acetyltransferase
MIETLRLRCEPVRIEHAEAIYLVLLDPRIYAYLPERPPPSVDALRKRYEVLSAGRSPDGREHWLNWMLFLRATGEAIGYYQATVRPAGCSIAYVINPAFWRRGYAVEAGRAIIPHLFERYAVPCVTAEIDRRNGASIELAKRLGLSLVRHDVDSGDDIFEVTRRAWTGDGSSAP